MRNRFLSWHLWHQLQTPPLPYWSVLVRDAGSDRYAYSPWAYISVALLIFSLGLVCILSGILWGMFIAANTASALTHERRRAALDLLGITPLGHGGVRWQVFKAVLHYDVGLQHFDGLRMLAISLVVLPLGLLLPVLALAMLFDSSAVDLSTFFLLMVAVSLIPIAYLDPIYGVLTGGLVAMLAAERARGDASVQAIVISMGLQAVGYSAALFPIGFLPGIYRWLGMWGWLPALSIPFAVVGLYGLVHEITLRVLWHNLTHED